MVYDKNLPRNHHVDTTAPKPSPFPRNPFDCVTQISVIAPSQQNAFIESFNGSLRDELLNEEWFDSLDDARRKLALWRYDYNNVRPHSSLENQTRAEARRALEQFEGSAHDALAQTETKEYENPTRKLSL